MKKANKLLLTFGLVFSLVGCTSTPKEPTPTPTTTPTTTQTPDSNETATEMTLEIIILDVENDTELFNDFVTVTGEVKSLSDFLKLATQLDVVIEKGEWGDLIVSMMGLEQNMDKGPWWLFESTTNNGCVAAGMCDSADNVDIVDNDQFTFKLTSSF